MRKVLVLCLSAVLLAACGTPVVNPVTGRTERTVMDERAELAEGRKAHEGVLKEYGAYAHPALQAYVNEVGQRLAAQSHRAGLSWTFTVLDSPEINAFALPGGYVYITRGILAHMDNEAEMAGVLGHEIGHVTARHGAQRATRQQHAGLGVLAATLLGAVLENAAGVQGSTEFIGQAAQGVAAGYVAGYSREQELEADALGAEYLARTRYDPRRMIDVIRVLQRQESFQADEARAAGLPAPSASHWLSTHPGNDQRLRAIEQKALAYESSDRGGGDEGRRRFLKALEGLRYGDGPEQGLVRGQDFYHVPLGFALTAPPGWRLVNGSDALNIVSPQGDAALRLVGVPRDAGTTHDEMLRKLFNPQNGKTTRGQINGLAATHFSGTARLPNGQSQGVDVTLVSGPKNATYALLYLAASADALQRQAAGMMAAEKSFRALSAADRQQARPWQIRTVALPAGGFAELARRAAVSRERLQLINGTYGQADPPAGRLVKTVVVE